MDLTQPAKYCEVLSSPGQCAVVTNITPWSAPPPACPCSGLSSNRHLCRLSDLLTSGRKYYIYTIYTISSLTRLELSNNKNINIVMRSGFMSQI